MELKKLILNSLTHHEVIEKIAEAIRDELINNQKLSDQDIQNLDDKLEVINLEDNSKTLLGDYPNLESAIEEVVEKEILINFDQDDVNFEM